MQEPNFISFTNFTYVRLKKGTDTQAFEEKLDERREETSKILTHAKVS